MLTTLLTGLIFAAVLLALSLGVVLSGRPLRKSCGDVDTEACLCARPCARRRATTRAQRRRGRTT